MGIGLPRGILRASKFLFRFSQNIYEIPFKFEIDRRHLCRILHNSYRRDKERGGRGNRDRIPLCIKPFKKSKNLPPPREGRPPPPPTAIRGPPGAVFGGGAGPPAPTKSPPSP